ncbi:MAG: hypothetical protein WB999_02195 [Candidatus Binataceae bacterium]
MDSETRIRLGAFLGVFVAMALWEAFAPRRALAPGRLLAQQPRRGRV